MQLNNKKIIINIAVVVLVVAGLAFAIYKDLNPKIDTTIETATSTEATATSTGPIIAPPAHSYYVSYAVFEGDKLAMIAANGFGTMKKIETAEEVNELRTEIHRQINPQNVANVNVIILSFQELKK